MKKNFEASEGDTTTAKPPAPSPRVRARTTAFSAAARVSNERVSGVEFIGDSGAVAYSDQLWSPDSAPTGGWSKRVFDVCFAAAALLVLAPLLLVVALIVRIDSRGKAIFKQERTGFDGRTFRIWKFRTMYVTENRGVVQARRGDVRITRLGAFLRRSSWDELPQLINVLIGDMSIIGPRPHALEHDVQFKRIDPRYGMRRRARPGVTGLAQVNGCRGPTETDEKVIARTGFDVEYVRNWSWWMDLKILVATIALVTWKNDPDAI